jgi:sulfate/thiosulfate-binding protein
MFALDGQMPPGSTGARPDGPRVVRRLYKNVPVLDTGARGCATTFVQRGLGDVPIAWDNEAMLALHEVGADNVEIVVPLVGILAEPPVVVDAVALRRGTREVAQAYLGYLYTPEGQEIIARNFYRPRDPQVAARYAHQFPQLRLPTIADFGGWTTAQATHFNDGGIFDQIIAP